MCGTVAAAAKKNIVPVLIEGLKKLEYRGYDSAGLKVIGNGSIEHVCSVGRVAEPEACSLNIESHTGIAHTRWATHGVPSERNAQPHLSDSIAVVHNGTIENMRCMSCRSKFFLITLRLLRAQTWINRVTWLNQ